jgi:hypothetical protein
MKKGIYSLFLIVLVVFWGCTVAAKNDSTGDNPPPPGTVIGPEGGILDVSSVQSERLTIEWTEASFTNTRGGTIWYSIVYSSVEPIDTLEKAIAADVLAGPVDQVDPVEATGLVPGATYFFNILFNDENGNQGIFEEGITIQTPSVDDLVPPVPGSTISFNTLQSTSLVLEWESGSDDVWVGDLYYKVFVSPLNNINSIADAETNGEAVSQWNSQVSAAIQNLLPDTTYYFNVLVRDRSGNINAYNSVSGRTFDEDDLEPPLLLLGSKLEISGFGTDSLTLLWNKAIDIKTSQQDLKYKVVYTLGNEITTVADALESGTIIADWTKNISQVNLTSLPTGELVYFSLLVSDLSGNMSIYDPAFVLFEDFEDETITGWEIVEPDYWQIILDGEGVNRVFEVNAPLDSLHGFAVTGESNWEDIAIQTKIIPGQYSQGGIVLRYFDTDNYYHVLLNEDQDKIIFVKVENGSITSLGEKSITLHPDTSYELYVDVQRFDFMIKVNDILELSVTDTTFQTGKAGLKNIINFNRFDDVKIWIS